MFGVLIVDDEAKIREGLRDVVDWSEYGLEILGEAADGRKALEMIERVMPKLVVTDIKMPVMDGIELIKEISKRGLDIHVIVLSGFDDFTYVKDAMKYGAENYLLKPVDRDELVTTLKEIVSELEKALFSNIQKREGFMILKNNVLNRIVTGEISVKEFREKCEFLQMDLYCSQLQVAVVELFLTEEEGAANEELNLNRFAACNICEEILEGKEMGIVFPDTEGRIVILFHNGKAVLDKAVINDLLTNCIACIGKYLHMDCSAGLGEKVETHRKISLSYKQAVNVLDYKLIFGANRVICHSAVSANREKSIQQISVPFELLGNLARTKKTEELINEIEQIYRELLNFPNATPNLIRSISMELITYMFTVVREFKGDISTVAGSISLDSIWKMESVSGIKKQVLDIVGNSMNYISSLQDKKFSKVVNDTVKFIEDNYYSPDISLKTISHQMKINSAHLGRIFKAETGEFFSDFLNGIRIAKAKEMLISTNLKVNDIALQVGFLNTSYFCSIFKKIEGINPSELREKVI